MDTEIKYSKEDERIYNKFNKVYSILMMKKYPYIKKAEIDKDSFFNYIKSEPIWSSVDVKINICADYSDERSDEGYGSYHWDLINQVRILLAEPYLKNRISPLSNINDPQHCTGLIRYYNE